MKEFKSFLQLNSKERSNIESTADPMFKAMSLGFAVPRKTSYIGNQSKNINLK